MELWPLNTWTKPLLNLQRLTKCSWLLMFFCLSQLLCICPDNMISFFLSLYDLFCSTQVPTHPPLNCI